MDNDPRTWKWMVPALLAPCVFVFQIWLNDFAARTMMPMLYWCGCATVPMIFIFAVQAVAGFRAYYQFQEVSNFEMRQTALNTTPITILAKHLQGMHPEAVRVLNRFGVRTSWQVKVDAADGARDWVLMGTNVHFGFIEFVLDNSNAVMLYPKNRFSEGAKRFDPDGITLDRDQYAEFEAWLNGRMMATRAFGDNHPAQWIPPWGPDAVKEMMGFEGPQDLYKPGEVVSTGSGYVEGKLDGLKILK